VMLTFWKRKLEDLMANPKLNELQAQTRFDYYQEKRTKRLIHIGNMIKDRNKSFGRLPNDPRSTFNVAAEIAQRAPDVKSTLPTIKAKSPESLRNITLTPTPSDLDNIYLTSLPIEDYQYSKLRKEKPS